VAPPRPWALAYIRVCTQDQVSGFGLDVQERAIRDYCKANNLRLIAVLRDEGQSRWNGLENRLGLAEALARLKASDASTLIVYRMEGLARDLILQETLVQRLRDQGTPVRSASEPDLDTDTDDPTKVLIRQIVGAVSQYERAVIGGRMMAGKAAKAARGGFLGGRAPYGFTIEDGQVVPDDAEQAVVALVGRLRASGSSLREIAAGLEAEGYTPRDARHWHPTTVSRIAAQSAIPARSRSSRR